MQRFGESSHNRYFLPYENISITLYHPFTNTSPCSPHNEIQNKKFGADFALKNFDEFYKPIFGKLWPSIRLGLLTTHKYCAVINNYAETESIQAALEELSAKDIRHMYTNRMQELLNKKPELREGGPVVISSLEPGDDILGLESGKDAAKTDSEDNFEDEYSNRFTSRAIGAGSAAASLQEFVPATQLKGMEDWLDETSYTASYPTEEASTMKFTKVTDAPILLPVAWKIYSFKPGDISTFPTPRVGNFEILDTYLMDMSSILPAFALNAKNGDHILDMCAAPGGKALTLLQTLYNIRLTCNDQSISRTNRLKSVIKSYLPKWELEKDRISIRVSDARDFAEETGIYDKILIDAPCTNDRLSANNHDNNIFNQKRLKERVGLPEIQTQLLCTALKIVKPGGYVVYSTCSLSPVQNDGVVHVALQQMWETSSSTFVVHDLTDRFYPFGHFFNFHSSPRYGQLVVPTTTRNFGPMYIAKISKV